MEEPQYMLFPHDLKKDPLFIDEERFKQFVKSSIDMYCISPDIILTCLVDRNHDLPLNVRLHPYGCLLSGIRGDVLFINEGDRRYSSPAEFLATLTDMLKKDAERRRAFQCPDDL